MSKPLVGQKSVAAAELRGGIIQATGVAMEPASINRKSTKRRHKKARQSGAPSRPSPPVAKKSVRFAMHEGRCVEEIHEVESFKNFRLWYAKRDFARFLSECHEAIMLYENQGRDYRLTIFALFESFNQSVDKNGVRLIFRFLEKNYIARGLENQIVRDGSDLRDMHINRVLDAQDAFRLKQELRQDGSWPNLFTREQQPQNQDKMPGFLRSAALDTSKHCQHVANMLGDFNRMVADKTTWDDYPMSDDSSAEDIYYAD
jgi:hypothetical protein